MKYFKLDEFRCRCCGRVAYPEHIVALVENVLDPLRERYGKPVTMNSGYRCERHNREVGGASQSQHMRCEAADITAGSPEENLKLAKMIVAGGRYDQMILYVNSAGSLAPRFIHVSWKKDGVNRHRILKQVVGKSGYQVVDGRLLQ